MALLGFELEEIARLLALAESQGLDEFILEEEGRFLRIRGPHYRSKRGTSVAASPAPAGDTTSASSVPTAPRPLPGKTPAPSGKPAPPPADQVILESPMVGVFYRADKPGGTPFVNIGDHVQVGQTVGVIEAMKVFSEFKTEHAGTIVSIPAPDGKLVQAGVPLLILRKD